MAMACNLQLFALSHLLVLFVVVFFIHDCTSCPLSVLTDCKDDDDSGKPPPPFTGLPLLQCKSCKRTCKSDNTTISCPGPDQALSIFLSSHTIALNPYEADADPYAVVCANFSSSPWINFTFLEEPDAVIMGCPRYKIDFPRVGAYYNSCKDDAIVLFAPFPNGSFPDVPSCYGCIKCHRLSSLNNFSVQYNTTDHHPICESIAKSKKKNSTTIILSTVLPAFVVISILLAVYWRRGKTKSGSRFLSRARSVPETSITNGVTIFSFTQLQEATNNFEAAKELGEGGFGIVYHGKLRDGREVAVKRMHERNYKQVEQFDNEIRILTSLQHPNLVTLYGCTSRHSRELLLVFEYIPNKTLADHLHGDQAVSALLSWPKRMSIAIETATALSYLHFKEVIHRDIKTDNILLDNSFRAKVADFGLSRLFPADVSHVSTAPQGTPGYLDPEYHQCYHLSDKSDVYSFGVVLVELISSLPAVDLGRHRHEVNLSNYAMNRIQCCAFGELVDAKLGFETDFKVRRMTTLVAELAFRCLQGERELRPSMEEVLEELKNLESADYGQLEAEEIGYEK